MRRCPRSLFYWLHALGGLSAGAVLAVMAATGAVLVFKPELDEALHPGLLTTQPGATFRSVDLLLATAHSILPEEKPILIRISGRPEVTVSVMFESREIIYLDPYTGAVTGRRNYFSGLFGRAEQIHRYLLMGDAGRVITGGAALVYVCLFLSGAILAGRARTSFLLITRLRGRAWLLNLHKVAGVYIGGIVLLSALSGLPHAFSWFKTGLYVLTGESPAAAPAAMVRREERMCGLLDHALAALRAMSSAARDIYFLLPAKPNAPLGSFYIAADAPHIHARSYVWFDAATGEVLRAVPFAASLRGDKLYFASIALHFGQFAGWAGRLVVFTGCAGLVLLIVTGTAAFWQRSRRGIRGSSAPAVPRTLIRSGVTIVAGSN